VSGPAAGLTVIVFDAIQRFGIEMLGLIVLIAGALQLAAGGLGLAQWFRAVSPAVIKGMLTGIGVLILASQFHVMVDDAPKGSGLQNLISIPGAVAKGIGIPTLAERDERLFRTHALRDLGELHRRQAALATRMAELHPEHPEDPTLEAAHGAHVESVAADVTLLAAEQELIAAKVRAIADQLDRFAPKQNGARSAMMRSAGDAAVEACHEALDDLKAGHPRVALGRAPNGKSLTVNPGIVSAASRMSGKGIQLDAKLNYGNVGGPVVDHEGRLVAVSCKIDVKYASVYGQNSGVGFAITHDRFTALLADLKAGKSEAEPRRPFLGIQADTKSTKEGVELESVQAGGAAEKAGIKARDVIVEFDGKKIGAFDELRESIMRKSAGDKVKVKVVRGEETIEFDCTLGWAPGE